MGNKIMVVIFMLVALVLELMTFGMDNCEGENKLLWASLFCIWLALLLNNNNKDD